MRDAVDFVTAPGAGQLIALQLDALPYTGSARPSAEWFLWMSRLGLPVHTMTQETISTRSQQGAQAGVIDCQFAESRAREVNPDVTSIAVVVSDGWSGDAWDSSEYARGWASVATLHFFPYGALGVINSFLWGARDCPLLIDGEWVPETWGRGRLMSQVVGFSPVPDTDLNHVWADYSGAPPAPLTPALAYQGDDMHIGVNHAEGWFVNEGGTLASHFTGEPGAFGVPADLGGAWLGVPSKVYTDLEVAALKSGPELGSVVADFDYVKLAAAVTAGIKAL